MSKLSLDEWRALSPYLDDALEMGDEERSLWLTSLRTRNPEIAEHLESLFQEHRALSQKRFLETPSAGLPGAPGLAGQTFGVYRLISQIGQGGMGSVWLAERNDGLFDRRVAVKTLNIALIGKGGEERFKREGSILGRLTHPHIAQLFDAGVSPAGQPYLVLEHVDGDHIDRYCDQRSLDLNARVRLLLAVMEAVAHAHSNLVVHRDIKPSNVLVTPAGKVKLLDFGIAKLREHEGHSGAATLLTREGAGAMTPEYAAPEQVTGEPATNATDIYGLGILTYVVLSGRHPAGSGPYSAADLVKFIVEVEPPPLSSAFAASGPVPEIAAANAARRGSTPEKLERLLRGDLDTIVGKALKKDPQERYASVNAMAGDLRRYLAHEPISARPDTIVYRAGKFARRYRLRVMTALLAATALVAAMMIAWRFSRASEALPQFEQRRLTASAADLPARSAAISPNGEYLAYADRQFVHLQRVDTGGTRDVTLPAGGAPGTANWTFGSWYPDSLRFLAAAEVPGRPVVLWVAAVTGGEPEKVAEVEDMAGGAKISPDGSRIAFTRLRSGIGSREIWLMGAHGESPRKILTAEGLSTFGDISWSPSGSRIVYNYANQDGPRRLPSVQSCDLNGANKTTIFNDHHVNSFAWVIPGRFIYSQHGSIAAGEGDNLWELRVDDNGLPRDAARRLTDWTGFSIYSLTASADGKRLSYLRGTEHTSVDVGDLTSNGTRLANVRRLVNDDNLNLALAWTPDSREVVFSAQRTAARLMYRQGLDPGSAAQLLTSAPGMNLYLPRFTPDGAWVLLEGEQGTARQVGIYRATTRGGIPKLLFPIGSMVQFSCTNKAANLCVIERAWEGKNQLVLAALDPIGGMGKELVRIPLQPGSAAGVGFDYLWQMSPDGAWIGLLRRRGNEIRLVPLHGGPEKVVTVKDYSELKDMYWSMDSKSLFVSAAVSGGGALLHVDFNGDAQRLWHQPQANSIWGFSSPDGRHLALGAETMQSDVWMISNF